MVKDAQAWLGYAEPIFVVHSMRHGSVTHDFMNKRLSMLQMKRRGGWRSEKSLLIYLQESQARLLISACPRSAMQRVKLYNSSDALLSSWLRI
jgi:hypothetical protein